MNVPRQKADFVEILQFNSLGTDLYYEFLNLGCKLTASSGSDVPWGGTIGENRAYACLGRKPFSADAWFEAFRKGRTFTTSGPMLEFRVNDALPGDELRLKSDRKLRVRARAWGDPKRMAPMELEIVRHGEVIRTAKSANPQQPEVELDFTLDGGYGCWLAARARAGEGTTAHTTPVYVVRERIAFLEVRRAEGVAGQAGIESCRNRANRGGCTARQCRRQAGAGSRPQTTRAARRFAPRSRHAGAQALPGPAARGRGRTCLARCFQALNDPVRVFRLAATHFVRGGDIGSAHQSAKRALPSGGVREKIGANEPDREAISGEGGSGF